MAPLLMTFSDLEGHFCRLKQLSHIPWEIHGALSTICLVTHELKSTRGSYFKNKRFLKVTASHMHCKCGNISVKVPDSVIVGTDN